MVEHSSYSIDMSGEYNEGPVFDVYVEWDGNEPFIEGITHYGKEMYDYLSEWTIQQINTMVAERRASEIQEREEEKYREEGPDIWTRGDEKYHEMMDTLREVNARRGYEE